MCGVMPICILFIVVCMQYRMILSDRKLYREREKELLNRIMTRNYETFIQGEVAKGEAPKESTQESLTPEEYIARYPGYGEIGYPVI